MPGLVQTESYARAVLAWKPESASAEANLKTRLTRQSVLDRAELRVVILGSVLSREVGDAAVMCEQIEHLLAVGSQPSVMIQIVPDTPAVAGALGGAFAIATEGTADVAAYTDSLVKGGVYTDPDLIARCPGVRWPARGRATVGTDPRSSGESRRAMESLNWRKTSYSAANGGCVEVADHSNRVLVRDTQDRTGPLLRFSPAA